MGTGKVIRCKECGCKVDIFEGVGFANKPIQTEAITKCPQCGCEEFEDTGISMLWD